MNSSNQSIWKGVVLVGGYLVLAKLCAAAKEMTIAWSYGISETVDAYVFVFNLVQWPATVIGSVLAGLLVPIAASLRASDSRALRDLRSTSLGFILLVGLLLALLAWLILPSLLEQPFLHLSAGQIAAAQQMQALVWTIPLSLLASLFAAWTLAANRHLNTLAEAVPPLGILWAVFLTGGIAPLVFGTVAGLLAQVLLLGMSLGWRGELGKPLLNLESRYRKMLLGGLGVMIVGQGLMSTVALADQFFAARLEPGSLATLGYANRVLGLFLALGSTVVARAVLPVFSDAHASSGAHYHSLVMRWAWIALGGGVIVSAVGSVSAEWMIRLLFERGRFGAGDSGVVAEALRYGFLQLPFFLSSTILVHALLGAHRRALLVPFGALALLTKLVLAWWILPILGLNGLLVSTAGVYLVTSLGMMFSIHVRK
jgi:peptidoglycan biosynthesis protein MviN/MurJ (putative lipid II flippase)